MAKRAGIIVHTNKKIVVIKRIKAESVYFVIPGDRVKQGESFEQAAMREFYEEIGYSVENILEGFTIKSQRGTESYFFARIDNHTDFTIHGEEAERASFKNQYIPMWVPIDEINSINLLPEEVIPQIMKGLKYEYSF